MTTEIEKITAYYISELKRVINSSIKIEFSHWFFDHSNRYKIFYQLWFSETESRYNFESFQEMIDYIQAKLLLFRKF